MVLHMGSCVTIGGTLATGDMETRGPTVDLSHPVLGAHLLPPLTSTNQGHPTVRSTRRGNPDLGGNQDPEGGPDHHPTYTGTKTTMKTGPRDYTGTLWTLLTSITRRIKRKNRMLH